MEPCKHDVAKRPTEDPARGESGRILIVGGGPEQRAALTKVLSRRRHRCTHVSRLDEAQAAVVQQRYDLIVLHEILPDGEGLALAELVQKKSPATKMMLVSGEGSFKTALEAIRCGVIDLISAPVDLDEVASRVEKALSKTQDERQRDKTISRLQHICRELSVARDEVADQVDALCNDLVAAYREMTEQLSDVAMASEFKTLLHLELDVEEMLRTTLEYLLTKTGPTNAAVFLPDAGKHYSLGAYVNYDCPRASIDLLLDHLCAAICPQMSDETEIVAFDDAREFSEWIGIDDGFLADSQVIAFSCMHEGECMAVVVVFRSRSNPFEAKLAGTLDILRGIFGESLARLIRIHHRAKPQWPDEAEDDERDFDDEYGYGGLAA